MYSGLATTYHDLEVPVCLDNDSRLGLFRLLFAYEFLGLTTRRAENASRRLVSS
jgi:hypothetical protein